MSKKKEYYNKKQDNMEDLGDTNKEDNNYMNRIVQVVEWRLHTSRVIGLNS